MQLMPEIESISIWNFSGSAQSGRRLDRIVCVKDDPRSYRFQKALEWEK
jgi:TFIIF-interacting CTD phosphatase-like protein